MLSHGVTLKNGEWVPLTKKQFITLVRAVMSDIYPEKTQKIAYFHANSGYAKFQQMRLEFNGPPK